MLNKLKHVLHDHKRVLGMFVVLALSCFCCGVVVGVTLWRSFSVVAVTQKTNVVTTIATPIPAVVVVATVEPTSTMLPAPPTEEPSFSADVRYVEELNECEMGDLPGILRDIGVAASENDVSALCSLSRKFEGQVGELLSCWAALPQPADEHLQNSRHFLGEALGDFASSAEALGLYCESDDVSTGLVFLTLAAEYMERGSDYLGQAAEELGQYNP